MGTGNRYGSDIMLHMITYRSAHYPYLLLSVVAVDLRLMNRAGSSSLLTGEAEERVKGEEESAIPFSSLYPFHKGREVYRVEVL